MMISTNPDEMLDGHFLQPNVDQYWHYLMKVKKKEGLYQGIGVDNKIQEIINVKGFNSFTLISDRGWTPSHVAVLANNEAGLKFLKLKGALAEEIKDLEGNTPLDLALKFRPELIKFFEEINPTINVEPSSCMDDFSFLENLFVSNTIKLPKKSVVYAAHSDDFGVEIKTLMFAKPNDNSKELLQAYMKTGLKIDWIARNMTSYAEKFGFKLNFSKHQYALRDNLIRLPNGNIVTMCYSKNTAVATERCTSRALCFREKAAFQTNHLFFKGSLGTSQRHFDKGLADLSTLTGKSEKDAPVLRFYMEGGNHYIMTNSSGCKVLLFGEDTLYISLNQMRRDKVFEDPGLHMKPWIASYKKELSSSPEFLMQTLEEMYAQGLLAEGKGFISQEGISKIIGKVDRQGEENPLYSLNENPYLKLAKDLKLYVPLDLSEIQKKNGIDIAAEYLAQIEFTKLIIAKSFSINPEQMFFIPQLDYHLDVFLRPGPNGSIFVQDYSFCVKLLGEIAGQSEALGLTSLDKTMLQRYMNTAKKLDRELGPLCSKVKEMLSHAGLCVIPAPGLFYDVSPDLLDILKPNESLTFNLNFLNAITGWSSKTKSYYYLGMGAGVGNRLGSVLMGSFENFLKRIQPDIEVGFLGYDPDNKNNFSEGMRWFNRRGSQAGPHCFAFALETISHESGVPQQHMSINKIHMENKK